MVGSADCRSMACAKAFQAETRKVRTPHHPSSKNVAGTTFDCSYGLRLRMAFLSRWPFQSFQFSVVRCQGHDTIGGYLKF